MVQVTFNGQDETSRTVDVRGGLTLMEAAIEADIEGVDGECGGVKICATCHVLIREEWVAPVGPADSEEWEILDMTEDRRPNSRLACQVILTEALNGLVVEVPRKTA